MRTNVPSPSTEFPRRSSGRRLPRPGRPPHPRTASKLSKSKTPMRTRLPRFSNLRSLSALRPRCSRSRIGSSDVDRSVFFCEERHLRPHPSMTGTLLLFFFTLMFSSWKRVMTVFSYLPDSRLAMRHETTYTSTVPIYHILICFRRWEIPCMCVSVLYLLLDIRAGRVSQNREEERTFTVGIVRKADRHSESCRNARSTAVDLPFSGITKRMSPVRGCHALLQQQLRCARQWARPACRVLYQGLHYLDTSAYERLLRHIRA